MCSQGDIASKIKREDSSDSEGAAFEAQAENRTFQLQIYGMDATAPARNELDGI